MDLDAIAERVAGTDADAQKAYESEQADARSLLRAVGVRLDAHRRKMAGPATWSFVGDVRHVSEVLSELMGFLR